MLRRPAKHLHLLQRNIKLLETPAMFFKMIFGPRTTTVPTPRSDPHSNPRSDPHSDTVQAALNPLLFLMHGRG